MMSELQLERNKERKKERKKMQNFLSSGEAQIAGGLFAL